ncbi:MAG: hypothetical protein ACO3VF_07505 [Tamlana sp.]|jgi:hypothetical protein
MRKLIYIIISISLFSNYSCDDGNVIDFEFNFDDSFSACEGVNNLVLYKTKNNPLESMSLLISSFSIKDLLAVDENDSLKINNKAATFNYRTYNDASISNLFCNDIPPAVNIVLDETDDSLLDIVTVLTEDDNDDVPSIIEDIDGDGNLKNDDSDGDGLPNYIDVDDDGDNVLTKDENPDPNGDGDLSDAQDTDGDGIPDYLDDDDDGDGVLTRDEENDSEDKNPSNDITNSDIGADYLNPDVSNKIDATAYRQHTYSQTYLVTVTVKGIDLSMLSQEELYFGVLSGNSKGTVTIIPDFN